MDSRAQFEAWFAQHHFTPGFVAWDSWQASRAALAGPSQEVAQLREAVVAMAEDGWLFCGPEGLSAAQEKLLLAYKTLTEAKEQK